MRADELFVPGDRVRWAKDRPCTFADEYAAHAGIIYEVQTVDAKYVLVNDGFRVAGRFELVDADGNPLTWDYSQLEGATLRC